MKNHDDIAFSKWQLMTRDQKNEWTRGRAMFFRARAQRRIVVGAIIGAVVGAFIGGFSGWRWW
jgi:hypothetical protein